jgi:uncharacterized phage protein gp47/JayE
MIARLLLHDDRRADLDSVEMDHILIGGFPRRESKGTAFRSRVSTSLKYEAVQGT